MKKLPGVFASVFAAFAVLMLAGCSDLIKGPAALPDGMGAVIVNMGGKSARTILPSEFYDLDLYYVLTFTPASGQPIIVQGWEGETVKLLPGNWTLDAKGFLSRGDAENVSSALVTGSESFEIIAGETTAVSIALTPDTANMTQDGSGKLEYLITLPAEASGSGKILTLDGTEAHDPVPLTGGTNEGTIELDSGFYYVVVRAELNVDGTVKEKVIRELAQIYDNAVTRAKTEFKAGYFVTSASAKINAFTIAGAFPDIDQAAGTIRVFIPSGTGSYSPAIEFEGTMISPASGETVNLSSPVTYTVYTEGGAQKTYTVTVSDTIEYIDVLESYLASRGSNTAANAYPLKVALNLDNNWSAMLQVIADSGKYVALDLSGSTGMTVFNPGTANTGEKFITALVLPDTAEATIDGSSFVGMSTLGAFQYFTQLKTISGAGIKRVGNLTFKGYSSAIPALTSFDFPKLESIGYYAFAYCSGLTSVVLPDSLKTIGESAFERCNTLTSVTIPDSVTSIEDEAFIYCSGLTSVTIGNGVTSIGDYVFQECSGLTSVTIGNSVSAIGFRAFFYCSGLTSVVLPDSLKTIGEEAFRMSGLTSVTIGNSVTSIENSAFSQCRELTSITIGNSVTSIGESAFSSCSKLTSVTIPAGVSSFGRSVFESCNNLTKITFSGSLISYFYGEYYGNLVTVYNASTNQPRAGTYVRTGTSSSNYTWTKL